MIEVRAGERVGRRGRNGRGRYVVHSLQGWGSFNTNLSARNWGHPQGRRRYSKPGLGTEPPETPIRYISNTVSHPTSRAEHQKAAFAKRLMNPVCV